jgi:hypothetical protein
MLDQRGGRETEGAPWIPRGRLRTTGRGCLWRRPAPPDGGSWLGKAGGLRRRRARQSDQLVCAAAARSEQIGDGGVCGGSFGTRWNRKGRLWGWAEDVCMECEVDRREGAVPGDAATRGAERSETGVTTITFPFLVVGLQLVSRSYRPRGLPIVMVSVFHLDDFNYFGGLSS